MLAEIIVIVISRPKLLKYAKEHGLGEKYNISMVIEPF